MNDQNDDLNKDVSDDLFIDVVVDSIVALLHDMGSSADWHHRAVSGDIAPTPENFNFLETISEYDSDLLAPHFRGNGSSWSRVDEIPRNIGAPLKIEFPDLRELGIYKDFAQFQSIKDNQYSEPEFYYLVEEKFESSQVDPVPENIKKYKDIITLIEVLLNIADYTTTSYPKSVVFLAGTKVDFPLVYKINTDLHLESANDFLKFLDSGEPHFEQKSLILKNIMCERLSGVESKIAFQIFLENFNSFLKRLKDEFQLFMSEFSFEKIREEAEQRKLEHIKNINGILGEVHNKLIAIPVALLLVATQMTNSDTVSLKNSLLLISAFLFAWLLDNLVQNQSSTLDAINKDIQSQKERLKNDYAAIYERFCDNYKLLEKRYKHQLGLLRIVSFIVAAWFLLTFAIFIYKTESLRDLAKLFLSLMF